MKKEQGKCEKGARGKKLKGAESRRGNCERSKENEPPLTEAQACEACDLDEFRQSPDRGCVFV